MWWIISTIKIKDFDGHETPVQLPVFCLSDEYLEIKDKEHAMQIGRQVVNPFGDKKVDVTAIKTKVEQ